MSKEFPLVFEEQNFSIAPPKLDGWMSRRAREKGVLKIVNAREEVYIRTQLKVMDIGPPLIDLYFRLSSMADDSPEMLLTSSGVAAMGPCFCTYFPKTP